MSKTNWILGDLFEKRYDHFGSISTLWEKKWKFPCKISAYPFHDGAFEDFEPIIQNLIKDGINDAYDDAYTTYFLPTAEKLTARAMAAQASDRNLAISLYKRAACVYRISRFPYIGSEIKAKAYEDQKAVYMRGAALWDVPMKEIVIPHTHADVEKGDGKEIPLYVRIPPGAGKDGNGPVPVVLLICGLDGHRPDNSMRSDEFLARGWASVIADIPGTADCPSDRADPLSPDRLYSSILDWIANYSPLSSSSTNTTAASITNKHIPTSDFTPPATPVSPVTPSSNTISSPIFDANRVIAWGLSAGGYYAIRLAHTHSTRLAGSIGQGAGTHHFLGREWLSRVDDHEYPFSLLRALVKKYNFKDTEDLMENAQAKYSLVTDGTLEKDCCRLLLVNGTLDGLMPIEDSMLLMEYGRPKEARFYAGMLHMGYPPANQCVWPWMEQVMATAESERALRIGKEGSAKTAVAAEAKVTGAGKANGVDGVVVPVGGGIKA